MNSKLFILRIYFFLLLLMMGCSLESDKSKVEKQNKQKFDNREEKKEAQFVVDAIDASYGILEVAQLGEQKLNDIKLQGQAKKIIETQTSVTVKLKTYAEENGISIPFSGPEKTNPDVKRLYDKSGVDFNESWSAEIMKRTTILMSKLEHHQGQAGEKLDEVLNQTISILKNQQHMISEADKH